MFEEYKVGSKQNRWCSTPTNNAVKMIYHDPYWELVLGHHKISQELIKEYSDGVLQMCFTNIDEALYFIFRVGNTEWYGAPYEPRMFRDKTYDFFCVDDDDDDEGAMLVLSITDAEEGELKAVRTFDLGKNFTNRLHQVCRNKYRLPYNESDYAGTCWSIESRYRTVEDLMKTVNPMDMVILIN